jgi:hypothetical protein
LRQVIESDAEIGDGVFIGGRDPPGKHNLASKTMTKPLFGLGLNSSEYSNRRRQEFLEQGTEQRNHIELDSATSKRDIQEFNPRNFSKKSSAGSLKEQQKLEADMTIEGTESNDGGKFAGLDNYIDPATGKLSVLNLFVDTMGGGDYVKTGGGDDVIYLGDDVAQSSAYTQSGNDFVMGSNGFDQVDLGDGDDVFIGRGGNDHAFGHHGNDILDGGEGCDLLIGSGGDDTLIGGTNNDILRGDIGVDTFIVNLQDSGADWIVDFMHIGDKIKIMNGSDEAKSEDWIIQESQTLQFEMEGFVGYWAGANGKTSCFNIINKNTGFIAASVSLPPSVVSNQEQFVSSTASSLEVVCELDAMFTI